MTLGGSATRARGVWCSTRGSSSSIDDRKRDHRGYLIFEPALSKVALASLRGKCHEAACANSIVCPTRAHRTAANMQDPTSHVPRRSLGRRRLQTAALLTAAALPAIVASCIRPPPYDPSQEVASKVSLSRDVTLVWDGDQKGGSAKEWANCNLKQSCTSTVKPKAGEGVNGSVGLEWHVEGKDWKGFGWNWHGFWPEDAGTDVRTFKNLRLWVRLRVDDPKKAPQVKDITVALAGSSKGKDQTQEVPLDAYAEGLADGKWHEVVIPLSELTKGKGAHFDLSKAWELRLGEYALDDRNFTVFVDNVGFDNEAVIAMVSLPEKREPAPLGRDALDITAKVELNAAGVAVSPYVYGVSHGDAEVMHEMGVAVRRQGGNLSSVYDWRTGFTSAGADWFFENRKMLETPHPEENWWVVIHRENKKYGMKSFFTLPSEWVAKDGTSVGFPKSRYPDCEQFALDRPEACNGKLKQKDKDGNPIVLRCGAEPSNNGKHVDSEYNVDLLRYCIKDAGFGRADQGGIDVVALDNEPMLYIETHRDMWCKGFSYDDYWERTRRTAESIHRVDPSVKVAGPALWGWTAYVYSSGDMQYRVEHDLGWENMDKLPDYAKYGPFARDFMRRAAEYKQKNGRDLIDIFVFHGYPMTKQLDWANRDKFANPSPELQELRVRDVRKFWDESYRDPETWMGKEEWSKGNIAYVPLMRRWMKEVGWNVPIGIGEYDHAGPEGGLDISSAVAQAESLAAFARVELGYSMYWADPKKHSPVYFAFKMFRNPDGKRTAVGDHFIVGEVSDPNSVGVYVYKDAAKKVASFVLTNKRAAKGAKVKIDLGAAVPAQKAKLYEFSRANLRAIGELPPLDVNGQTMTVNLAPMSIVRVDVRL
jgi:hypothetical protein